MQNGKLPAAAGANGTEAKAASGATKITRLEIENVKRVRAVALAPSASGLTIIGGRNNQGKTSVLDAIAWALGGDRLRPSMAERDGALVPPRLHVELSGGLVVERTGKNSSLKVIDPTGRKGGQQLLSELIETLALDLPRFLQASDREKADVLLNILGVGEQLHALERQEKELYNQRRAIGQIADQKAKHAKELPYHPDAPEAPVSVTELLAQQQEILARNGRNQALRTERDRLEREAAGLQVQLDRLAQQLQAVNAQREIACRDAADLQDQSTAELEHNLREIEAINLRVRDNLAREQALDEAAQYRAQYDGLTQQIEQVRHDRLALLDGAALPLPGLSVEDGKLTYNGQQWDNMSGSDQLKVATAIVRRLNPKCGFVLLDKLEQMDLDTLRAFAAWLEAEDLQAIATRVSTGDECAIIIEDGTAQDVQALAVPQKTWKAGEF